MIFQTVLILFLFGQASVLVVLTDKFLQLPLSYQSFYLLLQDKTVFSVVAMVFVESTVKILRPAYRA